MRITIENYGTMTEVSRDIGCPRTTLWYAVDRGEVPKVLTGGGTILVSFRDARKWREENISR